MSAVWMRARAELRSRYAAVLSLALIVGVIGGVVIAAAAGARRTVSAYPRFLQAENAMDTVVSVHGRDPVVIRRALQEAVHLPQVAEYSQVTQVQGYLRIPGTSKPGNVFPIVSPDGRFAIRINRPKILQGRMYDPQATDEIVPSFPIANDLHLHVGETVQMAYGGLYAYTPLLYGAHPPAPVVMHVVGIGAIPSMFQPLAGGYLPGVLVSSGFYRAYPKFITPVDLSAVVRFRHGLADGPAFRAGIRRISQSLPPHTRLQLPFAQHQQTIGVQQTAHAQAVALWVLAALVAVTGVAIFGQALARQTFLESTEYPTLRALGLSPQHLALLGMIRAASVGAVGAAVAVVVGFLLSPLTPTGVARIAEPHPGFAFDGLVEGLGAAATVLLVTLIGVIPSWRSAAARWTALGTAELSGSRRPSRLAGFAARTILRPSATAGVRMALEPGRGRTAVPVRATMFGAAMSLVALAAALSFGASLDHLVATPALSGQTWDSIMFPTGQGGTGRVEQKKLLAILDKSPDVAGYSQGAILQIQVGATGVFGLALDPRKGLVQPALIEGRLPVGINEIALGTETMREAGTQLGSTVTVHGQGGSFRMRVVGRVALPSLFFYFSSRPGQAAVVTLQAADRISPSPFNGGPSFVRFAPEVDPAVEVARLKREIPDLFILPVQQSAQLNTLNQVGQTPLILAGILALMAMATLAHTLITSIRRRRLDLAILKTLGFVRGQVSATVAWQATALGAISLVIGLPIGVVAGRWGWNVFADHLGVVPDAVVPALAILLAAPATIAVANLLAVVPGRIASRLRPGPVLRTE
jgi:ABC-type lipoprotein release transport system permease subunit